jgi:hypothetical protein
MNDRYIPKDYALTAKDERYGFEVYSGTFNGKLYAIAYGGKRTKPDWHFRFKDEARLKVKIEETLSGFMYFEEQKALRKARANAPHDVKIGDVFRCSWGYDQTNIDFFECTKVLGAMVEIRPIAQQSEETFFMQGECTPSKGHFTGAAMRKKVTNYGGEPSVRIYSFASAYRIKPVAVIESTPIYAASSWTAYA